MMVPTVHINGTSERDLLDEAAKIHRAVNDAMTAMTEGWPNARDFYHQGPDAYGKVRAEWDAEMAKLKEVREWIVAYANGGE